MREVLPEFLQRMKDLRYQVNRLISKEINEYEIFLVDLSSLRLRFSSLTPLIWIKPEMVSRFRAVELVKRLQDLAKEHRWRRDCIILLDGNGQELKLQTANQHFPRFVIIDEMDQQVALTAVSFTSSLLDTICEQTPISWLAPYQIGAPVEGSGFFGRKNELGRVLRQPDTSIVILGVRRIGKTSLLKEIKRRMLAQGDDPNRIIWLDCSTLTGPTQFVQEVVRHLNIRELPHLVNRQQSPFVIGQ